MKYSNLGYCKRINQVFLSPASRKYYNWKTLKVQSSKINPKSIIFSLTEKHWLIFYIWIHWYFPWLRTVQTQQQLLTQIGLWGYLCTHVQGIWSHIPWCSIIQLLEPWTIIKHGMLLVHARQHSLGMVQKLVWSTVPVGNLHTTFLFFSLRELSIMDMGHSVPAGQYPREWS